MSSSQQQSHIRDSSSRAVPQDALANRDNLPQQPSREQPPAIGQCPFMTRTSGAPVASNNDSLTAGPNGPTLLQDTHLLEKLAHQNRERIPERTVHAKGWGAFGRLKITHDISKYTCAKCLQVGKETPMLARFSTVAGESGAADLERDLRGFSLKFYTEEGNWDMVANNTPVFFVRDAMKFPDFIHALKRNPQTHQRSATALWDFWSLSPEALHQITWLMGDRGIPKTLRHMNGYGSHTFSLWNEQGERFWVKFHFKTQQGIECISNEEAERITGRSRDTYGEDLYNAIERGDFPKWKMQIQVMPELEAEKLDFNPFDLTKVWPHKLYPLQDVGEFELRRNPTDYFAEIEQASFSPANLVPGIGVSPDRMLQARLFAYPDTARYRLGPNYDQIPVNRPLCPVAHYHRDGLMNVIGGLVSGTPNAYYEPNSVGGATERRGKEEPPLRISGDAARYSHRSADWDDFSQPRELYSRVMKQDERERVHKNIAGSWRGVPDAIVERALGLFKQLHPDLEAGCRREWETVKKATEYMPNGMPVTFETPHGLGEIKPKDKSTLDAAGTKVKGASVPTGAHVAEAIRSSG